MSIEELRAHGLLLPKEDWGALDLHTSVNKIALLFTFALAAFALILIVIGEGQAITWIGAVLYVLFLVLFTLVSNAGIAHQARRIDSLIGEGPGPKPEKPDRV